MLQLCHGLFCNVFGSVFSQGFFLANENNRLYVAGRCGFGGLAFVGEA